MMKWLSLLLFLTAAVTNTATAHQASDSYLVIELDGEKITGRWDIAFRDLNVLIEVDVDGDGAVTRRELKSQLADILAIASQNLTLTQGDSICQFDHNKQNPITVNDEPYLSLSFSAICPNPGAPVLLRYQFLFETDLSHQSLFKLVIDNEETTGIITADNSSFLLNQVSKISFFENFFVSGFVHIMDGADHILFLLVLVIAVVLSGDKKGFSRKQISLDVVKLLTAFTVAHAITLGLSQTGIITLSVRLVESFIGLSVAIAAIDIFRPFLSERKWLTAFIFGLIHGLGFASALGPVNAVGVDLAIALAAFNLGIEFGQLALACIALFILLYLLHNDRAKFIITRAFAAFALSTGLYWFVQRAFGF